MTINDLLRELKIRFDTSPRCLTKSDYILLITFLDELLKTDSSITEDVQELIEKVSTLEIISDEHSSDIINMKADIEELFAKEGLAEFATDEDILKIIDEGVTEKDSEEGKIYTSSDGNIVAVGLSDGTVSIIELYLEGEDVTIPYYLSTGEKDEDGFDVVYRISSIGNPDTRLSIYQGSYITNLTISEGITSILESAFLGADIVNMNFPSTLSEIGPFAFASCDNLAMININSNTPPTLVVREVEDPETGEISLYEDHFKGSDDSRWDHIILDCEVHVPEGTSELYNQYPWTYWTGFYSNGNILE